MSGFGSPGTLKHAEQINGREGETATSLKSILVNFELRGGWFRPASSQSLDCFMIMKVEKMIAVFLITFALCLVSSCGNFIIGEQGFEEIARVKSPDGIVDAILIENNGGATTSYGYSVFIVPSGMKFDKESPMFKSERELFTADHPKGLQLEWSKPKFLEIKYDKARIFGFRNSWHSQEVQNYQYTVELRLVPSDESSLLEEDK